MSAHTSSDGDPRGRLTGVPPAIRRLWSLLYRATRRHAARLDVVVHEVDVQRGNAELLHRELLALRHRVDALESWTRGEGPP